jgi:hypothetical protein
VFGEAKDLLTCLVNVYAVKSFGLSLDRPGRLLSRELLSDSLSLAHGAIGYYCALRTVSRTVVENIHAYDDAMRQMATIQQAVATPLINWVVWPSQVLSCLRDLIAVWNQCRL